MPHLNREFWCTWKTSPYTEDRDQTGQPPPRTHWWSRVSDAILLFRVRHKLQQKTGICLMTVRKRARIFEEEQERQEILDRLRAGVTDAGHPDDASLRPALLLKASTANTLMLPIGCRQLADCQYADYR